MRANIGTQHTVRDTLIVGPRAYVPPVPLESADICLLNERALWKRLVEGGGLRTICCPQGRPKYAQRPWIAMPKEGRRFKPIGYLAVADVMPFTGTDQLVLDVYVPTGYDGVITDVVCGVTAAGPTGFVEGSGDVAWRLAADGRFLRDLGNIRSSLGSLTSPSPVPRGGLRVFSRNRLQFYVSIAIGAPINPLARIVCSITGWFYPR